MARGEEQSVELQEAVKYALDEARMVLPGIQALFGFQLIAVFNERFAEIFDEFGQALHLAALVLVALSCALAMTPAAFHRQNDHGKVSRQLLDISSLFIGAAMIPLMAAISIDVGLVGFAVTQSPVVSTALGAASALVFTALWIVFPRWRRRYSRPQA
jgi:membrane protein YdbS with pleckstrin-like domain